jgi:hypothetical protein
MVYYWFFLDLRTTNPYVNSHSINCVLAAIKGRREMRYVTVGATPGHTNISATAIYAER